MKTLIKIIFVFSLLVSGCSSRINSHTKYQQSIEQKQDKLNEDAKDFIATAKHILSKKNLKQSEVQKAIDIIEKGQTLLGAKVDDGVEFKNLDDKELDKAINDIFQEDKKDLTVIEDLEQKDKQLVSDIITDNFKKETIDNYERSKSIKRWCFLGGILSILGTLFYFFPTRFLSIGANIIGFFIRK